MVIRNSLYNLVGLGAPLVVAVVTIPMLIAALGVERFGILTLIWAVVSYFGLFDLGLGRVVTQQVAGALADGRDADINPLVGTSVALLTAMGIVGGLLMAALAPLLARELAGPTAIAETLAAFWWMAAAMPAIVLTAGYRGLLEATGRFALVNAIRLPMGIFTFAGPLAVIWLGANDLGAIAAALAGGRLMACVVHAHYALRAVPHLSGHGEVRRSMVRPLLTTGGWMTVSNIISPLMNYTDRFLLGFLSSASAVTYYATPQELILRLGIVPSAVATVLFPMFAAQAAGASPSEDRRALMRYSAVMVAMMAPFSLGLLLFADPLLALWISRDMADQGAPILQIMSVAALASAVAQVPFAMLQGRGQSDITAQVHLVELPLYLAALVALVLAYGAVGAAMAWLLRIVGDAIAMYWFVLRRAAPQRQQPEPEG